MNLRRHSRKVPKLNTASTADISFMLLVFFLVTTSMYVDKGLVRHLPPVDNNKNQSDLVINKDNVINLRLDSVGRLYVNDTLSPLKDLKPRLVEFIASRGKEHIISLDASPQCKYDAYFQLQNAIGESYKEVRKSYRSMPQRIAENYHEEAIN